jgi:streptomycin 6-kinase
VHARAWGVTVDTVVAGTGSLVAYGHRGPEAVVLKVVARRGDEWRSGEVASVFGARGVVRVREHAGGAVLMVRLTPGRSLVETVLRGRDGEATTILADVLRAMRATPPPPREAGFATVEEWGRAFEWYAASGDRRIPGHLVADACATYADLCRSQADRRLLHGDLQHSNVLFDRSRGWVAIDPKGVVGETEYELGALLRNPREAPELFADPATVERRLALLTSALGLDRTRALRWAFAQAVLSAI